MQVANLFATISLIPNQYKTDLFTIKVSFQNHTLYKVKIVQATSLLVTIRNLNEFQGYINVLIQGLFHCSVINLRFVVALCSNSFILS